jgi:hypothetical protein
VVFNRLVRVLRGIWYAVAAARRDGKRLLCILAIAVAIAALFSTIAKLFRLDLME